MKEAGIGKASFPYRMCCRSSNHSSGSLRHWICAPRSWLLCWSGPAWESVGFVRSRCAPSNDVANVSGLAIPSDSVAGRAQRCSLGSSAPEQNANALEVTRSRAKPGGR